MALPLELCARSLVSHPHQHPLQSVFSIQAGVRLYLGVLESLSPQWPRMFNESSCAHGPRRILYILMAVYTVTALLTFEPFFPLKLKAPWATKAILGTNNFPLALLSSFCVTPYEVALLTFSIMIRVKAHFALEKHCHFSGIDSTGS